MLVLHLSMHSQAFRLPAVGNHVWRQCNTLAMATNFAEEDMNILMPRIDQRFEGPGITGPEFPAYSWSLALLYKVFGQSETLHRWFGWILFAITVAGMYKLAMALFRKRSLAYYAAFFLCFVPELFYHSVNAVPDMLALCCMVWGFFFYLRCLQENRSWPWAVAMALTLGLAAAVKLQFLIVGFPMLWFFVQYWPRLSGATRLGVIMGGIFAVIAGLTWYAWADILTTRYGLYEFNHFLRWPQSFTAFFKILGDNLLQDLPETWVGYAFLLPFAVGIYLGIKHLRRNIWVLCWLAGFIIFYVAVQSQFRFHGYYTISLMPLLALCVARGFGQIFRYRYGSLAGLLLLCAPLWAYLRISDNWGNGRRIPVDFLSKENLENFRSLSAKRDRWIVGPDASGCVFFYYLHAKGFHWNRTQTVADFKRSIQRGAKGMITNEPAEFEAIIKGQIKYSKMDSVGNFIYFVFE